MKKLLSVMLFSLLCLVARATTVTGEWCGTTMEVLPAETDNRITFHTGYNDVFFKADECGRIDIIGINDGEQDYDRIKSNLTALLDSNLNLTVNEECNDSHETIDENGIRHYDDGEYHFCYAVLDFYPKDIDRIYIYGYASPRK